MVSLGNLNARYFLRLALQVSRMAGTWGVIGGIAGCVTGSAAAAGLTGYAAYILAGMIVFPLVGTMLGTFSASWRESFVCALAGLGAAILSVPGGTMATAIAWNMGLTMGGLIGATAVPMLRCTAATYRWLRRWAHFAGHGGKFHRRGVLRRGARLAPNRLVVICCAGSGGVPKELSSDTAGSTASSALARSSRKT